MTAGAEPATPPFRVGGAGGVWAGLCAEDAAAASAVATSPGLAMLTSSSSSTASAGPVSQSSGGNMMPQTFPAWLSWTPISTGSPGNCRGPTLTTVALAARPMLRFLMEMTAPNASDCTVRILAPCLLTTTVRVHSSNSTPELSAPRRTTGMARLTRLLRRAPAFFSFEPSSIGGAIHPSDHQELAGNAVNPSAQPGTKAPTGRPLAGSGKVVARGLGLAHPLRCKRSLHARSEKSPDTHEWSNTDY